MDEWYCLGIDTSCYTTSMAVVDCDKNLILEKRIPLNVQKGHRGLRQSEALFQHIKNLPVLFSDFGSRIDVGKLRKISVSSKPRNKEGSYMPVFLAGISFGKSLASILNTEYQEFSHQEGHIEASLWSAKIESWDNFIAVHISGGTTEILKVKRFYNRYTCDIIGGTLDISAGQLIDRVGVALGLDFPAGKELDTLSQRGKLERYKFPVNVKGSYINYSGIESHILRLINSTIINSNDLALSLFEAITKSLYKAISHACEVEGINKVLIAGGVASNSYIRNNLGEHLSKHDIILQFGKEEFSTDNAVGTALLAI